jgi:glutamate decarboxylase
VGWVIWRDVSDLPKELIFEVDYLGGSHANFSLNFSRGAAQIVAQYYNFIRLGKSGYRQIMEALADTAKWIAGELAKRSDLTLLATGSDLPVVCFGLAGQPGFSVFDLSALLRQRGWIVPAYKMAPDVEDVEVLRVVVREGLSRDLASELVHDIGAAIDQLAAGQHPDQPPAPAATPAPAHRRGSSRVAKPRSTTKTRAVC